MESSLRDNASNPNASKRATSIASATTSSISPTSERSWASVLAAALCALIVGFLLVVPYGLADDAKAALETESLQARLSQLQAGQEASVASGALEQAASALRTASEPSTDPGAAARATHIARAALVLASRQLDLHQSEAELVAARKRLDAIRARATAQRRVLEALLEERASLARGMEQP